MSAVRPPLFIVLEGLDGVGKSTLARLLAKLLGAMEMRTPPLLLAPLREDILRCFADSPLATTLYYAATVADASRKVAQRQAAGRAVVMDRYFLSTCVYGEVVRASDYPGEALDALAPRLLPADATIYLYAQRERRRQRMRARGQIGFEDQLTFEPSAAARLDAAFRSRSSHPLAGRFLAVDTTDQDADGTLRCVVHLLAANGLWSPVGSDRAFTEQLKEGAP